MNEAKLIKPYCINVAKKNVATPEGRGLHVGYYVRANFASILTDYAF